MPISLKKLISETIPNSSSGIFAFNSDAPQSLIIANRKFKEIDSYKELDEVLISEEEARFTEERWKKIKDKNPTFYDGYVTAIADVIYDETDNRLTFIMERTRYSVASAITCQDYPNKERSKDFIGFGLGLMSNLIINPDDSFLMVERSQKVHSEKGAFSVPGGALEYKEGEKDDVKIGFKKAAVGEVVEEILSEEYKNSQFQVKLTSISASKNIVGQVGLNAFFEVCPQETIGRREVTRVFANAKDGKYESTGRFFFVDPKVHVDERGENDLYAAPMDMIQSGKLQDSGSAALASQVYKQMIDSYKKGSYPGSVPHPNSIASQFTNLLGGFTIFDVVAACKLHVDRPLPEKEITVSDYKQLALKTASLAK